MKCPACGFDPLTPPSGSRNPSHHCGRCQRVITAEALVAAERRAGKKVERGLRRHLEALCVTTRETIDLLDDVMKGPSTPERGKKVARLMNALEMTHDRAWLFGLRKKLRGSK